MICEVLTNRFAVYTELAIKPLSLISIFLSSYIYDLIL